MNDTRTDFIPNYGVLRMVPSSRTTGWVTLRFKPRHFNFSAITDCRTDDTGGGDEDKTRH